MSLLAPIPAPVSGLRALRSAAQFQAVGLRRAPLRQPRLPSRTCQQCGSFRCNSVHSGNGKADEPLDAIFVLGGGLNGDGSLPSWVVRRLECALDLYQSQLTPCPVVCLGGGTPHKPDVVQSSGHVLHEATSCAEYLMHRGAPPKLVYKEISSYDTVGNAYFSLTIHAIPADWRRLAVVTSNFHMPRTQRIFEDVYGLAGRTLFKDPQRYQLSFRAASDDGLFLPEVLGAREHKEHSSLSHWMAQAALFTSLRDLHQWIHTEHLCYAAARQHELDRPSTLEPRLLATY